MLYGSTTRITKDSFAKRDIRHISKMKQILVIFALIFVYSARASSNPILLEDLAEEVKRVREEMHEIKRLRRYNIDADIIADLKSLIRSEIHSHKGNTSECDVGTKTVTTKDEDADGFTDTIPIPFGRNFKRIPK